MKYLNEESQFTRVSDAHAKSMMESLGYTVPAQTNVVSNVYLNEGRRFSLADEVVEAEDGELYVSLSELNEESVTQVDESGRESLLEAVSFEDSEYLLEGLYDDGEGGLFARLVSENVEEPGDEDEDEEEDAEEEEE
jgi:hypothetical protein